MKLISCSYIAIKEGLLKLLVISTIVVFSPFWFILWLDTKLDKRI